MKCPKCGAENPEGSVFCQECGAKFDIIMKKSLKVCLWLNLFMLIAYAIAFSSLIYDYINYTARWWRYYDTNILVPYVLSIVAVGLFFNVMLLTAKRKWMACLLIITEFLSGILPLFALYSSAYEETSIAWAICYLIGALFILVIPLFVKRKGVSAYSLLK